MLVNIHVKNMALIQEVDIDLDSGLNILTGETGAGKSIIIDSVNVALGSRNFKGFVKNEAEDALVELVFMIENEIQQKQLIDMNVAMEEDGQIIISRKLIKSRSISKINGETVPISMVKRIAEILIDIHGQHEHQSLLHKKNHLFILDEFAKDKLMPNMENYTKYYKKHLELKKALAEMEMDEASRNKEADFLEFEIREIEKVNLVIGEDEGLEKQYRKMSGGKKLISAAAQSLSFTSGEQSGAGEQIGRAIRSFSGILQYDEELENLAGQLEDIDHLLNDFNREIADYIESLTFDEEEFHQIEERLDMINRLKTKYGKTIEEILEYKEAKAERLIALKDYDIYLEKLHKESVICEKELLKYGKIISNIRKECAKEMEKQIKDALMDLNFLNVDFKIAFAKIEAAATGLDDITFMISTNPGESVRPLGDVASGGELSRIMLAIKTVMADRDAIETLIFDEIDVGISGRTAQMVSEKLALIARNHQVICITHLAQIASMADSHYIIEKKVEKEAALTTIRRLSEKEGIEELARILGGAKITETILESAREMKELAACTKKY